MQTMTATRRTGMIALLLLLLLAMVLQGTMPARAAAPWSDATRISSATKHGVFPDIAYDQDGFAHVVYTQTADFKTGMTRYGTNRSGSFAGSWRNVFNAAATGTQNTDVPHISIARVGGVDKIAIVAKGTTISGGAASTYRVYYRESLDGGATWSAHEVISTVASFEPDVVLDNTGKPHVVYTGQNASDGRLHIFYTTRNSAGTGWTAPLRLSPTTNTFNNYVAIDYTRSNAGVLSLHVFYMGQPEGDVTGEFAKTVFYKRKVGGTWGGNKTISSGGSNFPDIATDHVKKIYLTFHSYSNAMSFEPYFAESIDNGTTWATARVVGFQTTDLGARPGIGLSAAGDVGIAFDTNQSGSGDVAYNYRKTGRNWMTTPGWLAQIPGGAKEVELGGGTTTMGAVWHEPPSGTFNVMFSSRPTSPWTPAPTSTATPTNTTQPTDTATPTNTTQPTATSTPTATTQSTATSTPTATTEPTATSTPTETPTTEPGAVSAIPEIAGGAERTNNTSNLQVGFSSVQGDPTELRYAWDAAPSGAYEAYANPVTLASYPAGLTTESCPSKTLFTQVRSGLNTQASATSDSIVFDTGVQSAVTIVNPLGEGAPTLPGKIRSESYPMGAGTADYLRGFQYVYRVGQEPSACAGVASFDTLNNIETVRGSTDLNKNFWVTFSPESVGLTVESGSGNDTNYNEADIVASIRVTDTLDNVQVFTRTMHFDDDAPVLNSGTLVVGDQTGSNSTATVDIGANVSDSSFGSYPGISPTKAYWGIWVLVLNDDTNTLVAGNPSPSQFASYGARVIPLGQDVTQLQLNLTDSSTSHNGIAGGVRHVYVRFLDGAGNFSSTQLYNSGMVTTP